MILMLTYESHSDTLLKIYDIVQDENLMPELKTTTCLRCDTVNGPTSKFCSRCGMVMDMQTAQSVEQEKSEIVLKLMALIEKEPGIMKMLQEA